MPGAPNRVVLAVVHELLQPLRPYRFGHPPTSLSTTNINLARVTVSILARQTAPGVSPTRQTFMDRALASWR